MGARDYVERVRQREAQKDSYIGASAILLRQAHMRFTQIGEVFIITHGRLTANLTAKTGTWKVFIVDDDATQQIAKGYGVKNLINYLESK